MSEGFDNHINIISISQHARDPLCSVSMKKVMSSFCAVYFFLSLSRAGQGERLALFLLSTPVPLRLSTSTKVDAKVIAQRDHASLEYDQPGSALPFLRW